MAGILSYGAYVPLRRLGPGTQGWNVPTEKAVANWDEDSLTMAVAAATDCLVDIARNTVDGVYLATTTPPYGEKMAATTAAGFGVLGFASLVPLQQFGLITALTIVYSFLAAVLVQPAVLKLWAEWRERRGHRTDGRSCRRVGSPGPASPRAR